MAEEKLQYTLTLATRASGTGAKEVAADLQKVAAMSTLAADKAKVSSWAHYNLDEAMGNTAKRTETVSSGITKVGKSSRDSSTALLMFSQGFEDAQYGIRGVLNNIPPLVMALGGTARLAGVVSLAAVSFSMLGNVFDTTKEKAADLSDKVDEVADNYAQRMVDGINDATDAALALSEAGEATRQTWERTHTAEKEASKSALDNAAEIAAANRTIAELLGFQVNRYQEIRDMAEAAAKSRQEEARAKLEDDARAVQDAQVAAAYAAERESILRSDAALTAAKLEAERKHLATLEAQKKALEAIAKQKNQSSGSWSPAGVTIDTAPGFATPAAKTAQQALLPDGSLATEISGVKKSLDKLNTKLEVLTKETVGQIDRAAVKTEEARNAVNDTARAVEVSAQQILDDLAASDITAKTAAALETAKAQADTLTAFLDQATPQTQAAAANVAALRQLASDGEITANEANDVTRGMTALIGGMQSGMVTTNANLAIIIPIMNQFKVQVAAHNADLLRLSREVQAMGSRSPSPLPAR